ncbi:MAG: TIGR03752 family integrating conjugative element protein [Gammaproteobacteria bacterium]|nr:TIGR03752 family integrating conjugative element protein [Gammaproteobacteria bacterium]
MNKMLPLLMALVFVALGGIIYVATKEKPQTTTFDAPSAAAPVVGDLTLRATGKAADRDDPLETIKALTGIQERMKRDIKDEREANEQLKIEIKETIKQQQEAMDDRLTDVINSLNKVKERAPSAVAAVTKNGLDVLDKNMPEGLGFDDLPIGGSDQPATSYLLQKPEPTYISITPVGIVTSSPAKGGITGGLLPDMFKSGGTSRASKNNQAKASAVKTSLAATPRYTINDTATLYINSSMTALVGKVPAGGKLTDPYRFKLITGGENMAASGLDLPPGIKNIVWTGYTVGNRELSCVSGYLDTVSLVFNDGTISTTSIKGGNQRKSNTSKYLGYISDPHGNPCVRGTLYSNASDYLKDRIAVSALAAAGRAVALGETSTVRNRDGDYSTILDGNTGRYILGQTFSGGMDEVVDYVRGRMRDAYDVVYIDTGKKFTIHVESQIEFDYNPKGRKLEHANKDKKIPLASFD